MVENAIAMFLKEKRGRVGLTQRELDVAAKLPSGTVGQLESGNKLFSDSRIGKLARICVIRTLRQPCSMFILQQSLAKGRKKK